MRVRDSARHCAPVCYVQASAHRHDIENKVKKTFTYVSEKSGEEYSFSNNLLGAADDIEKIQALIKQFGAAKTKKERRKIRAALKDHFYSAKAQIFDAEDQMLMMTGTDD